MQYTPTNQMISPLSPTNRRAKTRRMRQVELPECAEDVIGNLHRYPLLVCLCLLFFDLITHLYLSNCLPKPIEQHFRDNVLSSILRHLINHLVSTGHLVLTCDPSDFDHFLNYVLNSMADSRPTNQSFFDDSKWLTVHAFICCLVFGIDSTLPFAMVNPKNSSPFQDSTPASIVTTQCQSLEWLNIPTEFGSALAHSNTQQSFDPFEGQEGSPVSLELTDLNTTIQSILSAHVNETSKITTEVGTWIRDLTPDKLTSFDLLPLGGFEMRMAFISCDIKVTHTWSPFLPSIAPTHDIMISPLSPTNRRAKTRRMRQVELPECAEDVIGNLHRYPLLVWYDPTASKDSEDSLLNDNHTKTLRSLVASKCEAGEEVEWHDLMEWFVCSVIGLNSKASWYNESFWFDWDDVVVDGFGTARINLFASHSSSSPPRSSQSFSDGITSLSQLFLDLIDHLSSSNCLPTRIEQHFRENVISSILRHLIDHLVITDRLVLTCDPSDFEELVRGFVGYAITSVPNDISLSDLMWAILFMNTWVHYMENHGFANPTVRLTTLELDLLTPQFTEFKELLEPELDEVKKYFDQKLIEEARRISSWKELLQKVAGGEEVENDTSFLKLPFFRPTLLSLQAKFQQLASSLDGSDENSTSSLHSSHSSPHTSLAAHLDSSLRTISSSSHLGTTITHQANRLKPIKY
ncbi:hypothetical protein BLNAU_1280 [Blattamonas nauphoetae]|uniref:Uncharacterized protein n=1 Tax=Blattamonas nauphoetae TaxID=2049346 RepID=A0ABQ9YIY1_9EUKA|nr:hypothetical protein BLNAU_1280 [Blattamonas nauphoetae]